MGQDLTIQPPSDSVALRINAASSQTQDLLDIYCPASSSTPCFSVNSGGALAFTGNNLTLGMNGQTTASFIALFGGNGSSAYLQESAAGLGPPGAPVQTYIMGSGIPTTEYVTGCIAYYVTSTSNTSTCSPFTQSNPPSSSYQLLQVTAPPDPGSTYAVSGWNYYAAECTSPPCTGLKLQGSFTSFTNQNFSSIGMSGASAPTSDQTGTVGAFSGYWFTSPTTMTGSGIPCFNVAAPQANVDCQTGNSSNVLSFNPMTMSGDLIYGGSISSPLAVATPNRLQIGTSGQFLTSTGTHPQWHTLATGDLPTGTVTTTGSPSSGNLAKFSGSATVTNGDLSGDCTTLGSLTITCTKTNGTAFAPSATSDTTNASNITGGTLAIAEGGTGTSTATGTAGSVVLSNSPTLVTPEIGQINDTNGKQEILLTATPSAVDGLTVTNGATGSPGTVSIAASGSDSNINLQLLAAGTGAVQIPSSSFSVAGKMTTNASGVVTKYNNVSLAGTGLDSIIYSEDQLNTSSSTGTLNIVSASAETTYRISAYFGCHKATSSASATLTLSWTDPSGTSQQISRMLTCTTLSSSTVTNIDQTIREKSSTTMTWNVTVGTPAATYDATMRVLVE